MLTNEQFVKLEPLTTDSRYGIILSDAIEIWKLKNVIPTVKNYGVITKSDKSFDNRIYRSQWYNSDSGMINCHCLIGACLINKSTIGYQEVMYNDYNISVVEMVSLTEGFDRKEMSYDSAVDAYRFGESVHNALWQSS